MRLRRRPRTAAPPVRQPKRLGAAVRRRRQRHAGDGDGAGQRRRARMVDGGAIGAALGGHTDRLFYQRRRGAHALREGGHKVFSQAYRAPDSVIASARITWPT